MKTKKQRSLQKQIITKGLWSDQTRECIQRKACCGRQLINEVMRADKKLSEFREKRQERVEAKQKEILKECLRKGMKWRDARARAGCRSKMLSDVLRENPELKRETNGAVPIPLDTQNAIDRMALDNEDFTDIVTAVQLSGGAVRDYIKRAPSLQAYYRTLSTQITMKERTVIEELLQQRKSYPHIAARIGFNASTVSREVRRGRRVDGKYSAQYAQTLADKRQLQKGSTKRRR